MKSVLNQLFINMNINPNSANNAISKILMKSFVTKSIPSIKDLSKSANVAESTISKFAISLGYKGYRELIFKLKLEISDRETKQNLNISNRSYSQFEENIIVAIREFRYFENKISKTKEEIKKSKKIYLFSSYQFQFDALFFSELLKRNAKECFFSTQMFDQITEINKVDEKDFVIFIVGGQDTKTVEMLLNNFLYTNYLVLSTHSKVNEFTHKDRIICIDSKNLKHLYEYRSFVLKYLFLQLCN
ncbi:hypothetical protein [Spiroplasma cantharicola]|uniref:HTH rpiR-type domain-containing protein n=1 Tax=Spiroplasma cantharicola TaxID=362837 RepID=A0A0M4JSX4_9MOLU|nr:hypothetical protein [Spiroplasma cantharicola]ALD66559.1 hypothetical protein SCANT_v1c06530 [Spiroplasma cantharicola]